MRLLQVEIHNCFKYGTRNNNYSFSDDPLTLLVGPNGAGKSSIFDAVTFALFERTTRWGLTHNEIIRRGQPFGTVELHFEKDDREYRIIRGRSHKNLQPTMGFECLTTKMKLSRKTTKHTNKEIVEVVGMDFDAFRNSVLFGQEDVERIIALRSGDRLSLLSKFLGIDFLDKCSEASNLSVTMAKQSMDELNANLSTKKKGEVRKKIVGFKKLSVDLGRELSEDKEKFANYSELLEKTKRLKLAVDTANNKIRSAKEVIGSNKETIDRLEKAKKSKPSDIKKLREQAKRTDTEYGKLAGLQVSEAEVGEVVQELREELAGIKSELRILRGKIKQIKRKKVCVECSREYTDAVRKTLIAKEQKKVDELKKAGDGIDSQIRKKQSELAKIRKNIARIESLPSPERMDRKISEACMSRESREEIERLKGETKKQHQLMIRQQSIIRSIENDDGYSEERLQSVHDRLLDIKGRVSKGQANLDSIAESVKEAKKELAQIRRLETLRDQKEEKLTRLVFVKNMFSTSGGLRQVIIENVLPVLNEKINRYLDALTEEAISVEFTTGVKTKSGKYRDKLDIMIWSPQGVADFASYSGGEKRSIVLSIGLGLAELAGDSVGAKCDFLLLDEVFGSLDNNARQRLVNLLYALQSRFKNVVVISHLSELRNRIPNVVSIKRKKKLSVIQQ